MKLILMSFIIAFTISANSETLAVEGQYKLGKKLFDKGVPATLHLNIYEAGVEAFLEAPEASCVFQFSEGTFIKSFRETVLYKGDYEIYTLPLIEACDAFTSKPLKLTIRKDFDGKILSVVLRIDSRRNRWAYFVSK